MTHSEHHQILYHGCRSVHSTPSEKGKAQQQRQGDAESPAANAFHTANGGGQHYVSSIPGLNHRQEQVMLRPAVAKHIQPSTCDLPRALALWPHHTKWLQEHEWLVSGLVI